LSRKNSNETNSGRKLAAYHSMGGSRTKSIDGPRASCISFSASTDARSITSAVCMAERSTRSADAQPIVWTNMQPRSPLQPFTRPRERRKITLESGLSCTVDVNGDKAAQLAQEASKECWRTRSGNVGGDDTLRGLSSGHQVRREQITQLRERLQPSWALTVSGRDRMKAGSMNCVDAGALTPSELVLTVETARGSDDQSAC
jgi:hypothetical protein